MFTYCTNRLGFSEHVAFKRITAARLARKFPAVLRRIACGDLNLTAVKMLATVLTAENHERVLALAAGKKTEDVRTLAASLAPKPDVPPQIRKLPDLERTVVGRAERETDSVQLAMGDEPAPKPPPPPPAAPIARASDDSKSATRARRDRGAVAPLREDRFKVQFTASTELRDKLQKAEELLGPRHARGVAKGDIASVVERALDELIEVLEKKRFAKTARPQKKPRTRKPGTRYVPRQVRREVAERDGGRCTFVDKQGRRCDERRALEFHHRHAFALGGEATAANISMLCRPHNTLEAEQDFGAEHMERARRAKSAAPPRDEIACAEDRPKGATLTSARPPRPLHVRDGGRRFFSKRRDGNSLCGELDVGEFQSRP